MERREVVELSEELATRFRYHPPSNAATVANHERVRLAAALFASAIVQIAPAGRHRSLSLTAIEEAMHWANAAIACDPANVVEKPFPEEPIHILTGGSMSELYVHAHVHNVDGKCLANRNGPTCPDRVPPGFGPR